MAFPSIADPKVLAVPIIECGEPMIDVKTTGIIQYGPTPEDPATEHDYTKMRAAVFERLCQAQALLPAGFALRLYEGLRSYRVQQMLFDAELGKHQRELPNASYQEHFTLATRLISPVTNLDGSINIPPHCTGAAVDVEIIDEQGTLLDMGMAAKDWYSVAPELCQTDYADITPTQKANRQLLLQVMTEVGFVNYPNEWWHYSYGDRYWALLTGQANALYDAVTTLNKD